MSGYLTAGDIRRTMDDLWRQSRPSGFTKTAPSADEAAERASDEVEKWTAAHPRHCGAVLFPLEPSRDIVTLVVHEAWANGVPVHPLMVPYGDPVQGPRPATCSREPHPGSPWHWAYGTWWRGLLCSGGSGGGSRRGAQVLTLRAGYANRPGCLMPGTAEYAASSALLARSPTTGTPSPVCTGFSSRGQATRGTWWR